ncbi:uncharacterized protein LOC130785754 [Actinidia eriantha]|uniref:uncharacterized protein LOC130785754 n=1 Tax=Actinidia eriantha TaxID=165200 RepID=UPI0025854350|nr:uncharacterized protein LOC130785754 [Actinidia eriantha]
MVTICQQCGDKGFENAFVFCVSCLNFAVHRYCLPKLPETFDEFVCWFCEDCQPKPTKPSPVENPCSIPSTKRNHRMVDVQVAPHNNLVRQKQSLTYLRMHRVCDSERRQISPSQQPPELANDFSPPKIQWKKREASVIRRVAETEAQRH